MNLRLNRYGLRQTRSCFRTGILDSEHTECEPGIYFGSTTRVLRSPCVAERGTPAFLNDIVLRTTDTPIGVCPCLSGIGPRTKSDFVRFCPCLSGRSVGVRGSFVGDPNQPVPDADPMHGNQISHGTAERLVGAFLGPCW
jgi:hypothetical protein